MSTTSYPRDTLASLKLGTVFLLCPLIALCLSASGEEQKTPVRQAPHKVGVWTAWDRPLPPRTARYVESTGKVQPFTGVEARTMLEHLARMADVFRSLPVLNPPMGFEVHPQRHFCSFDGFSPEVPGPMCGFLDLDLPDYWTNCDTCKVMLNPEPPEIGIRVNSIEAIYARRQPYREDQRGPMYRVPQVIGHAAGFPMYNTGFVVLTKINRPLWVPVSQERFLRNEIRTFKLSLKPAEDALAQGSAYQKWLRESEKRKRDRQQAYEGMRQFNPQQAAEFRAQSEKIEREVGESLKASEAHDVAQTNQGMESARRHIRSLEDELASLSPAARASPAYFMIGGQSPRTSGLADPGAEGAELIVQSNPEFFDRGKAVTSIQLVAVRTYVPLHAGEEDLRNCEDEMKRVNLPRHGQAAATYPDLCFMREKLVELWRHLDWSALAALLD